MKRKNPTISEFNLMCRRYAGLRPLDDKPETEDYSKKPVFTANPCEVLHILTNSAFKTEPFCPDKILGLSISIIALRGFVGKCRISGFPEEYTRALLKSLFCKKNEVCFTFSPLIRGNTSDSLTTHHNLIILT